MRRLSPYVMPHVAPYLAPLVVLIVLVAAPFVAATLTAHAGPPLQEGEGEPVTPQTDLATFVLNTRLDLERLADEVLGPGRRPDGWIGNMDPTTPSIIGDLWLDLEQLADEVFAPYFSPGARPINWLGAGSPTPDRIARNLRHDLELLADFALAQGERPEDWIGAPPLYSCDGTLLNLVDYLNRIFGFVPTTSESVVSYCNAVAGEAQDALTNQGITLVVGNVYQLLENIRGDLERLADELNGLGVRPAGWRRTITPDVDVMAEDLGHDLELLADQHFRTTDRPSGWIGSLGSTSGAAVRNLRHDLEILADLTLQDREYLESLNGRPFGWLGVQGFGDNLTICDISTQSLVLTMTTYYGYEIPDITAPDAAAFCRTLDQHVNNFAETDPEMVVEVAGGGAGGVGATGRPVGESQWAFAYLDVAALQYMGIMPAGTPFEAWYRNFGESTMMYVVGENFAVYLSHEWTTISEATFYRLPTLQGVIPETYCMAEWCAGPGPTPTPTGMAPTPTPGAAPGGPPPGGGDLVLVPWNQVNVFYEQDFVERGTAYVRMELCGAVGFACEPVQAVFDQNGMPLPVINVIGAYPVFEMPYGYSSRYILQSSSYYANEVWISDPTLRGSQ
ncbi:MAG: hypothetical protein JW910_19350 [Anaerolineae bacterium]|nr:hypothetical protein [Anaerolineae bacterium]